MTGIGTRRTSPPTTEPSGYWLTFDGVDDFIALPSGHGQEPSTALFIEMWLKDIDPKAGAAHCAITRGNYYTNGFSFSFYLNATTRVTQFRLALDNGAGYTATTGIAKSLFDSSVPIYVAAGWDGTTIYYFVQGMLIATASASGTLEYTGTLWTIGDMQQSSAVWPLKAKLGMLRVSNICRRTASFTPPVNFVSDIYTVGLWKNTEGAGTTIIDSGPGGHTGAFKAAGEPAWSDVVDLSRLSHGDDIWRMCLDVVPTVTGTNVWLKRISANEYVLYKKIHETGPYWSKWVIGRYSGRDGPLEMATCYTGIPTPSNETPNNWTSDPTTRLISGAVNEYVFMGHITGAPDLQWGNGHLYELLDSESWTVDGVATTLADGAFASGSEIIYRSAHHAVDPTLSTTFANITKSLTLNAVRMYLEGSYTFDWVVDWFGKAESVFPLMTCYDNANLTTATYVPGGTDYTIATGAAFVRAHGVAAWKSDNGCIMANHIDLVDGLRYGTDTGSVLNAGLKKLYFNRTVEIDGAKAGTRWAYSGRWMALDNCGNHFLKTT